MMKNYMFIAIFTMSCLLYGNENAKINLTRIESISMIEEKLDYAFFLDFLGNPDDKIVKETFKRSY